MIKQSLTIIQILLFFNPEPLVCGMQQSFSVNNMVAPREDIFIHTDREVYIAGENLWYAAYLFDRQNDNQPGRSKTAYIELLNSGNNPVVQKRIGIENGSGNGFFVIPDTLSSGLYILRAYTNWMKNFPSDECFYKQINIYNSFGSKRFYRVSFKYDGLQRDMSPQIISVRSPDICRQREKITLDIALDKAFVSSPEKARLSISVASGTGSAEFMSIRDYIFTGSESGQWSGNGPALAEFSNKLEEDGHYLAGKLISQNLNESLEDRIVFLSIPGKEAVFQYAVTDEQGNFNFLLQNNQLQKDLVIQQAGNKGTNLIRIESSFWDKHAEFEEYADTIDFLWPTDILELSENHQVARIYGINSAGEPVYPRNEQTEQVRFYGIPDFELIMADYILLPVMQEVFFELIPGVSMRTGRSRYGITISNPSTNKLYDEEATLMVDGVIIDDSSIIVEMNPEIVERIDIVRTEHITGGYHFYGIVSVITKAGNFNSFQLPENAVRFTQKPLDPVVHFVSPDYSASGMKESRIPDFRNTLFWNPSVELDEEGNATVEFWSSDYVSDYVITIQGMTSEGWPVSFKKILKVE